MYESTPIRTWFSLAIVGLGILFVLAVVLSTLTGRARAGRTSSVPKPAAGNIVIIQLLFVVAVFVGLTLLLTFSFRSSGPTATRTVATRSEPAEPVTLVPSVREPLPPIKPPKPPKSLGRDSDPELEEAVPEKEVAPAETPSATRGSDSLPAWTQNQQTVLSEGEVPSILFVESSGLYSSQEEALAEATTNAIRKFRARLAETYQQLAVQPVPEEVFRTASIQKTHTEKRIHTFGVYEEPMYRVYLQYKDSAKVREPVIEVWKTTFAGNRAMQYGLVLGLLTVMLGAVSVGLRAVSAPKGSRGRAVMTMLAIVGAGATVVAMLG